MLFTPYLLQKRNGNIIEMFENAKSCKLWKWYEFLFIKNANTPVIKKYDIYDLIMLNSLQKCQSLHLCPEYQFWAMFRTTSNCNNFVTLYQEIQEIGRTR